MSKRPRNTKALVQLYERVFVCPSCAQLRNGIRSHPRSPRHHRSASTLSSNTAVNASRSVPDKYKTLYTALSDLRRGASVHLSLGRLQLALQGLETTTPKIRVAVLGLNAQDTARRIVRLLLADPLDQEARWEKELAGNSESYEHGVVIRFGQSANPNVPQSRSTIPTLDIPSSLLERNNLEILVSSVNRPSATQAQRTPIEAFLAPAVGTPTAYSGRQTMISQPVHRALVVAKGLEELFQVAELLASVEFVTEEDRQSIAIAMQNADIAADGQILTVDAGRAERGIDAIRQSLAEATTYEHLWVDSGMPNLSKWLARTSNTDGTMPSQISSLISSILQSVSRSLEFQAQRQTNAQDLDLATLTNLGSTIDEFSRNAHQELQSGLASAWSSRNWRKLAWYKLFWRVDDVGLIVTDLITNAWLPRTEKAVYELSGRLAQAGISPMDVTFTPRELIEKTAEEHSSPATQPLPILQAQTASTSEVTEPVITNQAGAASVVLQPVPEPTPLSVSISARRTTQITRAIESLTTQAQQLVLRTMSITGLSAGLSGLTYLSITPGSLYEAGTIVAVGTTFALWRMQGGWQSATKRMENELFDEGRSEIRRIVGRMRQLVEERARPRVDQAEEQRWRSAWASVRKARAELDKLVNSEPKEQK
ncbi:uncharacterized protein HMPREF1541_10767 [Cyphellophora europaea CBS 101466]|uniref:Mmc1 C-terminal domain-containing protein n=1 Tax=Cyphellophora europaea (strain CBS 101466) TaxID=1220924 RepID=W2S680_CYPE1|nr:uncharacterized protein HMPREF1541_10767 [Cyphellophora europaea CBS 101466]ETN44216.1 hypothetical protein HMPREF1541_10767 [Cyphellophora europaea CBS 101466]